jgi:hypothetical protein
MQAPGVSQDSAASGLVHVRNNHANVQFRINGVERLADFQSRCSEIAPLK